MKYLSQKIALDWLKKFNNLDFPARPRWPLDDNALFMKGAGVKL